MKDVVSYARKIDLEPHLILTSPLARAIETAAIASKHFPEAPIRETTGLLPDASPDLVWKELGSIRDVEEAILVGHEPHLSRFLGFLLDASIAIDIKKGGMIRVSTQKRTGAPKGILKWAITPRLARLV